MKRAWNSISKAVSFAVVATVIAGASTRTVHAKEWQANLGGQSRDLGKQALAFLSNELWIHAGDSIRWTFSTNELHTVTFLKSNQIRPPLYGAVFGVFVGCPGATPDGSSFDNSRLPVEPAHAGGEAGKQKEIVAAGMPKKETQRRDEK